MKVCVVCDKKTDKLVNSMCLECVARDKYNRDNGIGNYADMEDEEDLGYDTNTYEQNSSSEPWSDKVARVMKHSVVSDMMSNRKQ